MQINSNYNSINTSYKNTKSNAVNNRQQPDKSAEKIKKDTYTRSTPEDKRYLDHTSAYHQYIQAVLTSSAIKHKRELTASEELKLEPEKEFPSPVESCECSNHTHNNETHSYNQDSNPEKRDTEEFIDVEIED